MIFNKLNSGADEAKELLGFIYSSNNFDNMITYVNIAEKDMKRTIGPEVFKLAEDHYKSDNYKLASPSPQQALLDELVKHIQLPVLLHAYRRYAPLNDLSHSESGRNITVTEQLKPAFEWMLERDNKSLLDLAHETTELLITFLDDQVKIDEATANEIEDTWRSSTTFAAQKDLFINSVLEFDNIFPIAASRRLFLVLVPFIREMEFKHIRPVITSDRYNLIRELIKDGDLDKSGNEVSYEIHRLSKVPIALFTISIALKRLSVELLPDSVVQSFNALDVKQSRTADSSTRNALSALLERDALRELVALQNYITSLLPVVEVIEETFDTTTPFSMF